MVAAQEQVATVDRLGGLFSPAEECEARGPEGNMEEESTVPAMEEGAAHGVASGRVNFLYEACGDDISIMERYREDTLMWSLEEGNGRNVAREVNLTIEILDCSESEEVSYSDYKCYVISESEEILDIREPLGGDKLGPGGGVAEEGFLRRKWPWLLLILLLVTGAILV